MRRYILSPTDFLIYDLCNARKSHEFKEIVEQRWEI